MKLQVYEMVKQVLAESHYARNSDLALAVIIWKKYYSEHIFQYNGMNSIQLESLKTLPLFDTISRARRMIQNDEGLYLPTNIEVVKARRINEELWRNAIATKQTEIFNN